MTIDQQNQIWASLTADERSYIREDYENVKDADSLQAANILEDYFGLHNLTSDTEPEEMLIVKRNRVQNLYSSLQYKLDNIKTKPLPEHVGLGRDCVVSERGFINGAISALKILFGDKCLLDKSQPKFQI